MQGLIFCNNIQSAQVVFPMIQRRLFAGVVVPSINVDLITELSNSGYIESEKLFTPNHNNDDEIIDIINRVEPDVCLVFTYPKIFSQEILDLPKLGFYNFHYGLLPKYRSADPIFWQIKNRESFGGVTVLKMDKTIDGGEIVMEEKFPIEAYDSYAMLLQKSVALSIKLLNEFIDALLAETLTFKPQGLTASQYFPKPILKDVTINWSEMAMSDVVATVNAGNPWNRGAITNFEGENINIVQVSPAKYDKELPDEPGKIIFANQQYGIFIVCKNRELLRIETIYSSLGYNSGGMILSTGIQEGKIFD